MTNSKKILLFADWYEPGYKAGGPIRSCVNFVRQMRSHYRIYIFTSDRDLGSSLPYEEVGVDEWRMNNDQIDIYYCSPGKLTWQNIRRQIAFVQPDFIYLNSMFSPKFTIYPLLISRLYRRETLLILSPRGMLRSSAIQFKTGKKKLFLKGLRALGLNRAVHFHATDETEAKDIRRFFGKTSRLSVIANFPGALVDDLPETAKYPGELALIFIGRIHPIKNLDFLLVMLKEVKAQVRLTIIGNLEEETYWEKCRKIIAELPANITVDYHGEIANRELSVITAKHHIFVLPTKGENFGHAIFEALALGKPVLISDQTPWRNLQAAGAGWDLRLDRPEEFLRAIEQAAAFGQEEYNLWCRGARRVAQDFVTRTDLRNEYLKLFE
jgi:glycosyltransferase involved in cell wall biosynthesis